MFLVISKNLILVNILIIIISYSKSWRSFNIDLTGYKYRLYDNETFDFCHFELLPYKKRNVISGSLSIKYEVKAFKFQVEFSLLRPQSEPFTLLNMTTDGCAFLASAFSKVNMMTIILGAFRNGDGYFPDKCPLIPHKTVTMNSFFFDPEKFPPYTLDTDFMCLLRLFTQGKEVFSAEINGSIFPKNKRRNMVRTKGGNSKQGK